MSELDRPCPLAPALAGRMRMARDELTTRWLDRIVARVSMRREQVFPTDELLDHVPLLIDGIADYLENPAHHVSADNPVIGKAMELGALRHAQGVDEYQILKEYEIFGGILFTFLGNAAELLDEPCSRAELLICAHRVYHAVALIQQATITHYLRLIKERVGERESRLRTFNRALSHELKNQIGAALGAIQLLELDTDMAEAERARLLELASRNIGSMRVVLDNLLELSTVDEDTRHQRHVTLRGAATEAARELRDMAEAAGVHVRLGDLPEVEVSAAAVELALTNYISNGIKYADPSRADRWLEVRGRIETDEHQQPCELVVEVCDNGIGVPPERRSRLFERGFRAHDSITGVEGTGLGLSIVREAVESLSGRVWAEFPSDGAEISSVFAFGLPCRRRR